MIGRFDGDEDRQSQPDLLRIDEDDALLDDAGCFQPLNPLPARRLGQVDLLREFSNRDAGIFLQKHQNFSIRSIHYSVPGLQRRFFLRTTKFVVKTSLRGAGTALLG
jgi:hypothetical protein